MNNEGNDFSLANLTKSDPVFIWAPAARCGVTLLQRLITSSREIFIYGENRFFTDTITGHYVSLLKGGEELDIAREKLVAGDYNFWSSAAQPRTDYVAQMTLETFYRYCGIYTKSTLESGFKRWGVKTPINTLNSYLVTKQVLVNSQHIFVYRNLEPVLCSYKSRKWINNINDIARTSQLWAQNMNAILKLEASEKVLVLQYEKFIADQEGSTRRLCAFLNIPSMDQTVFDKKVNIFGPLNPENQNSEYVKPTPLTDAEKKIMKDVAGPVMEQAGY